MIEITRMYDELIKKEGANHWTVMKELFAVFDKNTVVSWYNQKMDDELASKAWRETVKRSIK